jgi:hypothetical protein
MDPGKKGRASQDGTTPHPFRIAVLSVCPFMYLNALAVRINADTVTPMEWDCCPFAPLSPPAAAS